MWALNRKGLCLTQVYTTVPGTEVSAITQVTTFDKSVSFSKPECPHSFFPSVSHRDDLYKTKKSRGCCSVIETENNGKIRLVLLLESQSTFLEQCTWEVQQRVDQFTFVLPAIPTSIWPWKPSFSHGTSGARNHWTRKVFEALPCWCFWFCHRIAPTGCETPSKMVKIKSQMLREWDHECAIS